MSALTKDLICFSHLRWEFVYQRPQHLMSRFARECGSREGRVFFWEEPYFESSKHSSLEVRTDPDSGVHVVKPLLSNDLRGHVEISAALKSLLDEFVASRQIDDLTVW